MLLVQLKVSNYALIDEMSLDFSGGFNVLTGETGAGKSIIVDTVMLLLGARAKVEDIRKGEKSALVEGVFEVPETHKALGFLQEMGIEKEMPLILTRELQETGKNRCRINHRIVTLAEFKKVAESLVTIYGQHDYQNISRKEGQLDLLDSLGDAAFQSLRQEVASNYLALQKTAKYLKREIKQRQDQSELLERRKEDLEALIPYKLKKGEEQISQRRFLQLSHLQALREGSEEAVYQLYSGDESCYSKLYQTISRLEVLSKRDEHLSQYLSSLEEAMITIDEIAKELSSYKDDLSVNEGEVKALEERLELYDRLKRRYKMDVDTLIDEMAVWEKSLLSLEDGESQVEALKKAYLEAKENYQNKALALREARKNLAQAFSQKLLEELSDLSMEKARFEVEFSEKKSSSDGIDEIVFMLSANPGLPLRPLEEVASGGEMSRLMLAFKTILTQDGEIETLIFDEIDTGIGGLVLGQVAKKLALVGARQQVLVVTHAPAIAAKAESHFYIEKLAKADSTITRVTPLATEAAVIDELARMLGGKEAWQIEHAKALREDKK